VQLDKDTLGKAFDGEDAEQPGGPGVCFAAPR
jgi:hypothetical protein